MDALLTANDWSEVISDSRALLCFVGSRLSRGDQAAID